MTPKAKAKATKIVLAVGIISLIAGFFPGIISYKLGIVVFLFSMVALFAVKVAVPKVDEPQQSKPVDHPPFIQ